MLAVLFGAFGLKAEASATLLLWRALREAGSGNYTEADPAPHGIWHVFRNCWRSIPRRIPTLHRKYCGCANRGHRGGNMAL